MKLKLSVILIVLVLCMAGCSSGANSSHTELPSSEQLLNELQEKNENLDGIIAYTESTDPNGNLGRPNQYISKADFSDSRVEQFGDSLSGGTIETFSSKEDCQARYDYLEKFTSAELGAFGLNQYMYKYDLVIFRVTYDLTPEQAEEYHSQMDEIMEQYE